MHEGAWRVSTIVSGAAAAALAVGLAAGLAFESRQVQPHILQVQQQGPPGPALIETLEAAAGSTIAAHNAVEAVPGDVGALADAAVSDVCRVDTPSPMAMDAVLCALSGSVEKLLEPLLGGTQFVQP